MVDLESVGGSDGLSSWRKPMAGMERRKVLRVLGGVIACPSAAIAQSKGLRKIGSMASIAENDPVTKARLNSFRLELPS